MEPGKKLVSVISRYNLNGILLETYPNAMIAAKAMNCSGRFISYATQGKRIVTAAGYVWRRGTEPEIDLNPLLKLRWLHHSPLASKQHTVAQYDLEGKLVNTYVNTKVAGKAVGMHYQGIRRVMRGEGLTCGGFIWSKEIKKKIKVDPRINADTTISQYDLDGKWIQSFKSAYIAGEVTGIDDSSIGHVIHGRLLAAGNFLWRKGAALRINVNELRRHKCYEGSTLQRHMKRKREAATGA